MINFLQILNMTNKVFTIFKKVVKSVELQH